MVLFISHGHFSRELCQRTELLLEAGFGLSCENLCCALAVSVGETPQEMSCSWLWFAWHLG